MQPDLLPMSVGDIFDEAFDLYKRNFALFAGIVALIQVPGQIAWSALIYGLRLDRMAGRANDPEQMAMIIGLMGLMMLAIALYSFFLLIQQGALTAAVSDRYLGRRVTIGTAYRRTIPNIPRLVVTWFLIACLMAAVLWGAMFVLLVLVGSVAALSTASGGSENALIGVFVVFYVLSLLALLGLLIRTGLFATQIIMVEGSAFTGAIERNWKLVRGRFWRVLGFVLSLALIMGALMLAIYVSLSTVLHMLVFSFWHAPDMTQSIVFDTLYGVLSLFLQPFWLICLTLLYYDLRVRREGFDLSLLESEVRPLETTGSRT